MTVVPDGGTALTVVQSIAWRSNLAATVTRADFPSLWFPCLGIATTQAGSLAFLWLYEDESGYLEQGHVALTVQARKELGVIIDDQIEVGHQPVKNVRAWLPSALDLPPAAAIYVGQALFNFFRSGRHRRVYALLTAPGGTAMPVRLYRHEVGKPLPDDVARVSRSVRALCGLDISSTSESAVHAESGAYFS